MKNRFYVYRYAEGNFRKIIELGIFDTDLSLHDCWDLMFKIFCKEGEGMFVREEALCLNY